MVESLAIWVIIGWLTIIYIFSLSLYLSEKAFNGKHFVHGKVARLLQAPLMMRLLMFAMPSLESETEPTVPLQVIDITTILLILVACCMAILCICKHCRHRSSVWRSSFSIVSGKRCKRSQAKNG